MSFFVTAVAYAIFSISHLFISKLDLFSIGRVEQTAVNSNLNTSLFPQIVLDNVCHDRSDPAQAAAWILAHFCWQECMKLSDLLFIYLPYGTGEMK